MGSGSVVIRKVVSLMAFLNYYFEHSLIFRACAGVGRAARTSRVVRGFLDTDFRDYWEGSIILRVFAFVASVVFACAGWIVRGFVKANESSVNRKFALFLCGGVVRSKAISGCAPVRLFHWYFADAEPLNFLYMVFLCGVLIVPSPMWNNMFLLLSAAGFAVLFAMRWLAQGGSKPDFSRISAALVVFVAFCALSIFTGYGGMDSVRVFIIFFACVVHSVLVTSVFRRIEDMRLFLSVAAVALVVVSLFGFWQLFMGIEIRAELVDLGVNPGLTRLYSTMGNPNNDAKAWSMLLPFVIAGIITAKCDTKRLVLAGAVGICVAALALTYSRSGYVALAAGMGIFVLMAAPRLVPIALLMLIVAIPFIPSSIMDRLLTLGQDSSSQYRFQIWEGVGRMLGDFWVRGIGMGPAAFVRIYQSYAHPAALRALHSHNTFLDILSHSGIGALLAFLAYLFRLFKQGIASHVASTNAEYKMYMAAAVGAVTVFIVFGVGEYVWFYPRVMLVFWVVAGILGALVRMRETT